MKSSIKRMLAIVMVFAMMIGMMPNMQLTAHAAGYADAIESITIDGTAITDVTGTQEGTNWSYDGTRAVPRIYLDNYNGGAIYVKGKSDAVTVGIEIRIKGDCSITAPAEAIKLDANNAGTIIISTDAGSTLTTNSWYGIYNAATKNPTVEFTGSGKVKINATGGIGIWAQQNPVTDGFAVSGSISVSGLVSLEANAPGSVVAYGYNADGTGVRKVNFDVSGGASVKFTKTNASKPNPVVFSPETITVNSGYTKSLSEDGTVFRLYKPVAYTISFEGSNTLISPVTTNDDGTLSSLPTPTALIPGQEFVGWYTAEEGGEKVTTDTVFTSNTTLYARWNKEVTPEPIVISELNATVVAPVAGEIPSTVVTTTGVGYTVSVAYWYDKDDNTDFSKFEAGGSYEVQVTFTPEEGYVLADEDVVTATINGKAAEVYMSRPDKGALDFGVKFDKLAEPPASEPIVISELNATVVAPVAGEVPSTVVTTTGVGYTVSVAYWYDKDDNTDFSKFEAGGSYEVQVTFTPEEGYVLADEDVVTATINGKAAEVYMSRPDKGALDFGIKFDKLAEPECDHAQDKLTLTYEDETGHWYECECGEYTTRKVDHEFEDAADTECECGYTRTIETPDPECDHENMTLVYLDGTGHWSECTAEGCEHATEKVPHVFETDADTTCECGYTRTIETPDPECDHAQAKLTLTYEDETGHWYVCECEEYTTRKVDHEFDNDEDTTCECGYTRTIEGEDVTPPTGDDNDKPSGDKDDVIKPSDKEDKPEADKAPQTGDDRNMFMWFAAMILAGITGLGIFRKRKAE